MIILTISAAIAVLIFFIAVINVQNQAPHIEEDDWFINDYLPQDPDLDGDITDADLD